MKLKTLLITGAALAAGVMSSSASVYSQNIVGYVNVVVTNNGDFTLLNNPLDDGNGNYLTNIFKLATSPLVKNSQCLTWNQPGASYNIVTIPGNSVVGTNWPANTGTQIPPGTGFFIKNGKVGDGISQVYTQTFVGTVLLTGGLSVTNPIPSGFEMYGSTIPEVGNIANAGTPGGDPNFDFTSGLNKNSKIFTWDPVGQSFAVVTKPGNSNVGTNWATTVTIGVAQGFLLFNNTTPTNVVQTANY